MEVVNITFQAGIDVLYDRMAYSKRIEEAKPLNIRALNAVFTVLALITLFFEAKYMFSALFALVIIYGIIRMR